MVDLSQLKVSLTKNGPWKVAEVLKFVTPDEVLDHVEGRHEGIDVKPSQVKNMLDANTATGELPGYWHEVREAGDKVIDAFVLLAMLYSHARLIKLMIDASQGQPEYQGYFMRRDLTSKEYTNMAYAFGCFGLSDYRPGMATVEYDFTPAIYHLRNHGHLVRKLLMTKMKRAGWRDPANNPLSVDAPLMETLKKNRLNRVVSMQWNSFSEWLDGRLEMQPSITRFGLREVRLFRSPFTSSQLREIQGDRECTRQEAVMNGISQVEVAQ